MPEESTTSPKVKDSLSLPVSGKADPQLPPRFMMKTDSQQKTARAENTGADGEPKIARGAAVASGALREGKMRSRGAPGCAEKTVWVKQLGNNESTRKPDPSPSEARLPPPEVAPAAVWSRADMGVLGVGGLLSSPGRKGLSFWKSRPAGLARPHRWARGRGLASEPQGPASWERWFCTKQPRKQRLGFWKGTRATG